MTRYARKKGKHTGYTAKRKDLKTKRLKRQLDQIDEDMQPDNAEKLLNQNVDVDIPGSAQFYCLHCARYFIDNHAMKEHFRSKVHKRRLKALETEPYTQKEAEACAGLGNYQAPKKRKVVTQPVKE